MVKGPGLDLIYFNGKMKAFHGYCSRISMDS